MPPSLSTAAIQQAGRREARHESNAAHTWMRELLLTSVSRL
jgi:hypothetical protein